MSFDKDFSSRLIDETHVWLKKYIGRCEQFFNFHKYSISKAHSF